MSFYDRQEKGRQITIKDEGVPIATNVGSLNFTGAGVSGSAIGSDVTEDIPGGGGSSSLVELVASDPVTVTEGKMIINTSTNEMKVGYLGIWQTLHTLTTPEAEFYLNEDGSYYLQEDGVGKYIKQ